MYLISLIFGYVLAFTGATLAIGRSLNNDETPTGYQDAITPPRFTSFALLVYSLSLGSIIFGFYVFGWIIALTAVVGLFVGAAANQALILPKSDNQHFRNLIIHSMMNRHADYLKSGDTIRALAMAKLIEKLGIPVNSFITKLKGNTNEG